MHEGNQRRRGSRPISNSDDQQRPKENEFYQDELSSSSSIALKPKKRLLLPWPVKYIAWFLCLTIMFTSAFFLWAFAVQFGNDKTRQWFTSMISAFFAGLIILEPVKVVLVACFYSFICKRIHLDRSDIDEDEEREKIVYFDHAGNGKNFASVSAPIDDEKLELLRTERKNEVAMWRILRELAGYAIFIGVVYALSFGHRDPAAFRLKTALEKSFIKRTEFHKVRNSNDWWRWAHKTLIPQLRAQNHYNGVPPFGLRGFIGDHTNRIMGYALLRQVRVRPNSCRVDNRVKVITEECARASAFVYEDDRDYCDAWEEQTKLTNNLPSCQRPEFKYTTAASLDSLPYTAKLDIYGGGGYVYRLNGPQKTIKKDLFTLQQHHWVNNHTRALFLEFSVFNAQVNLFGICTIVAEFIPGGGIMPFYRIDGVRLLESADWATYLTTTICQGIFVAYIAYFFIHQFYEMKREGFKVYWRSYWAIAEWAVIGFSFAAIGLYFYRYTRSNTSIQGYSII